MSSSLDIANKFNGLLDEGKFEEASTMLTDDFEFSNPRDKFDKAAWIKEFPALHKDPPKFEDFQPGSNDKELVGKGKKRIAMINFSVKETWIFTDDGKIKTIA